MVGVLVSGGDQELRAVGAHPLVIGEGGLDTVAAFGVGALADEFGLGRAEPLRRLRDALVHPAELGLRLRYPQLVALHGGGSTTAEAAGRIRRLV